MSDLSRIADEHIASANAMGEHSYPLLTPAEAVALWRVVRAATEIQRYEPAVCDDAPTVEVCTDAKHKCSVYDRKSCELVSALNEALDSLIEAIDCA